MIGFVSWFVEDAVALDRSLGALQSRIPSAVWKFVSYHFNVHNRQIKK